MKEMFGDKLIENDHKKVYNTLRDVLSCDFIDPLNLTTDIIEQSFSSSELYFNKQDKDFFIEDKLHIEPSMVAFFYYFIAHHKKIPTQNEYIRFYVQCNMKWIAEKVTKHHFKGLVYRLQKFYPSMCRDIHFYHLLKEMKEFKHVLFSIKFDLESKIDCLIQNKSNKWYGVQLRTKTPNSNHYYNKKKHRDPLLTNIRLIDVPIYLNRSRSVQVKNNTLSLYDETHVILIRNEIEKAEKTKQVTSA
jgi:hypothetical protein